MTAVLVKYTFPYDWSWVESLLFGAMFSATDPVAVVAVLKEVSTAGGAHHAGIFHPLVYTFHNHLINSHVLCFVGRSL